jgi:transglutaminase-like putative cysteine protease
MEGVGVNAMLGAAVRRVGVPTILIFTLVLFALITVAWGLVGIVRGLDLDLVLTTTVLGLVTTWFVARSALGGIRASLILGILGISTVFVRVGSLGGKILTLIRAVISFYAQLQRGLLAVQPVVLAWNELSAGVSVLTVRINDWLRAVAAGAPNFDPVATALVWSAMIWFCAAWAGWFVRRRAQPVPALLPALGLLVIPFAYSGAEPILFAVLVLFLFFLMVVVAQVARERDWQRSGIDFSDEIRFDLALVSVPMIVLLASIAAIVPSVSIQDIAHWTAEIGRTENSTASALPNSLGLAAKPRPATAFDSIFAAGLPRSHLIGTGPELTRRPVMTIKTNDPKFTSSAAARRYYWRASTYDVYTGQGWMTSGAGITNYRAGTWVRQEALPNHRLVQQEVHIVGKSDGLLYAAGEVLSADPDYAIAWRGGDDAFSASMNATGYRVQSWVATADGAQLKNAGGVYPQAIRERYLALPDTIPTRVLDLARSLTATEPTPYDRARAIEKYLRAYPYTLDLPEPPANVDVADYFLFDLRRGYCDYYATAFVVLARAAGLPARLVVGYATGRYAPAQGTYEVTEADAHSWPQVYFPEYGWIDFEPTGGRAELAHAGEANLSEVDQASGSPESLASATRFSGNIGWLLAPIIPSLLIVGTLADFFIDNWRLQHLSPKRAVSVLYQRLYQFRTRLNSHARSGDTPYQVAAMLGRELEALSEDAAWHRFMPRAIQDVRTLTELYVRAAYSAHAPDSTQRATAIQIWSRLRWRLWLAWLCQKWLQTFQETPGDRNERKR